MYTVFIFAVVVCFRFKTTTKGLRQDLKIIESNVEDVKRNIGEYSITQQSIGTAIQSIAANRSIIGSQVPMRAVNVLEEKYSYGEDSTVL